MKGNILLGSRARGKRNQNHGPVIESESEGIPEPEVGEDCMSSEERIKPDKWPVDTKVVGPSKDEDRRRGRSSAGRGALQGNLEALQGLKASKSTVILRGYKEPWLEEKAGTVPPTSGVAIRGLNVGRLMTPDLARRSNMGRCPTRK